MNDLTTVIDHAEVLIVGNPSPIFRTLPLHCRKGQVVIDLAGIEGLSDCAEIDYHGITW
jgi:hypothetical protein